MRKQTTIGQESARVWAEKELATLGLGDQRLNRRAKQLLGAFAMQPNASIPQACGNWHQAKAAYRFFENPAVEAKAILAAHRQSTLGRVHGRPVVLAVQDTTFLNYSTHPQTDGLGPIGSRPNKPKGLLLHATLLVSPQSEPLGLIQARVWARSRQRFGRSSQERNALPVAGKESQKWIESWRACQQWNAQCADTQLVNVADRDGDLYELFELALRAEAIPRVEVLVRAQHNRQVHSEQRYLWDMLESQPVAQTLELKLPRQPGKRARVAELAIRYCRVTLKAPCLKERQAPLTLWAIQAAEAGTGPQRICWRLLTTLPVQSAEAAAEKVRWYALRWQIEVLHKILKSGCQIELRQLETAQRLERVLMLDLIVAWRIMALCKASRETPEALAGQWLAEEECQVLRHYPPRKNSAASAQLTLREAVRRIAQLGGFLARKSDGEPGPITLWRGLQRLHDLTASWAMWQKENCG